MRTVERVVCELMPHLKVIVNGIIREDAERTTEYTKAILSAAKMDKEEECKVQAFIDGKEVEV